MIKGKDLKYLVLGSFLVGVFFGKLFYPEISIFVTPDFGASDLVNLNIPLKFYLGEALREGRIPFWCKELGGGFPIFAEGQIGALYIFNIILLKFLPFAIAYNLNYLVSYFIAFLFSYFFVRGLKLSRMASTMTAVIFTFSSFIAVHLHHYNLVQAGCYLPAVFYFLEKVLREKNKLRWSVGLCIILSLQVLTGYVYMVFITLVGGFSYLITKIIIEKKWREAKKSLVPMGVGFILALGICAVQLIPTWEFKKVSHRAGGLNFLQVTSYPYPLRHIVTFVDPYLLGDPRDGSYPPFDDLWGIFWENTFYLGILPIIFIFLSLWKLKDRRVKVFWLTGVFSFLLVLGKNSPIYFLFYFPGFNWFRAPSKYLILVVWFLAILSAYGFTFLIGKVKNRCLGIFMGLVLVLVTFWQLFMFYDQYHPIGEASKWLSGIESGDYLGKKDGNIRVRSFLSNPNWNDYFSKGWKDIEVYKFLRNGLYPDINLLYGIENSQVNTGGLSSKRYMLLNGLNLGTKFDKEKEKVELSESLLKMFSVNSINYIVSPFEIESEGVILEKEIKAEDNKDWRSFKIYRNERALNKYRLYKPSQIKLTRTAVALNGLFYDYDYLKNDYLVLEKAVECRKDKGDEVGEVEILEDNSEESRMSVESGGCRLLVFSDSFMPGWRAFIDGEETEILAANVNQKAVVINRGKHEVVFKYLPKGFKKGLIISVITIFLTVLLGLFSFLNRDFYKKWPFFHCKNS